MGDGLFGGMGGLEPGIHEGRAVWRAKLKIERDALDIRGTCRIRQPTVVGTCEMWERGHSQGWGAWSPMCTRGRGC